MNLKTRLFGEVYQFSSVKEVLAKASEEKSGDKLAGIVAENTLGRIAAKEVLSQLTIAGLRNNPVVDHDEDEVTRVIQDTASEKVHNEIKSWTIADLREYIIDLNTGDLELKRVSHGLVSEVIVGVTKLMSNMDSIYAAKKLEIAATYNTTIGKRDALTARLQPNHTTGDVEGIELSLCEGLTHGVGDAVLGLSPVDNSVDSVSRIYNLFHEVKDKWEIPARTCVLAHVTTVTERVKRGVPADLVFQDIAGDQKENEAFRFSDKVVGGAYGLILKGGTAFGPDVMYFEIGQRSGLSSDAHRGADQLIMEARCYGRAKKYNPYLINTAVGFIGPEYLYNSKQVVRTDLEDHFMGKLTGISMDVDICHINHMKIGTSDLEVLATLLRVAEVNYVTGIPGGDDIMLNYQTSSYQDNTTLRTLFSRRPIKEFEERMEKIGLIKNGKYTERFGDTSIFFGK